MSETYEDMLREDAAEIAKLKARIAELETAILHALELLDYKPHPRWMAAQMHLLNKLNRPQHLTSGG